MARFDEVVIGGGEGYADYTLKAISEDRPCKSTVTISGAPATHSAEMNGVYRSTEELYGGDVVYKKDQVPVGGEQSWLEFNDEDEAWEVVEMASRADRKGAGIYGTGGSSLPLLECPQAGKFGMVWIMLHMQQSPPTKSQTPQRRCPRSTTI